MASNAPFVVTGASSGIGNASAERLLAKGHRLITLDIKPPKAKVAEHISCDLSDPDAIDKALGQIKGPIAALLNIAGVPDTGGAEQVMRVNILGLRQLTEGLWDRIETGGRIVNIASIAGNNWRKRRAALVDLLATRDFAGGLAWWKANEASIGADAYTVSKEAVVVYTMQLAARGLERPRAAIDSLPKHLHHTMDVNVFGPWFAAQAAVKYMTGGGAIINMLSPGSDRYLPKYAPVGVSKGALESLTKYLAVELAPRGIRVNAVSAGLVAETDGVRMLDQDMVGAYEAKVPAGRHVLPADVADAVAFLCSDASKMIIGQVLLVDGGYSLLGTV